MGTQANVEVIVVTKLVFDSGMRSSRAWIEGEVVSGITGEVKAVFKDIVDEKFKQAVGGPRLVESEVKVACPV